MCALRTVQRECTAVPLLSGMGKRRSFTHPETDKLGESTAADETSAPRDVPDRVIHLSDLIWNIHSEISGDAQIAAEPCVLRQLRKDLAAA